MHKAVSRFPLTVFCLGCATILVCYMISLHKEPGLLVQKLMFTFLLGTFLSMVAQFSCERFERLQKKRIFAYLISALLTAGYYFILLPAPSITFEVRIRTFVAVFAMFCAFIWVPSYKGRADFNNIALIHFKSAITSILYSAVLSAGCSSIIATINFLLFKVSESSYAYMMAIIWLFFATLYYLSLLPRFNSETEDDQAYALQAALYPQTLKILISYIVVPLIAAYSLVLIAYFIKILITLKWPSGQLGPMILAYSAIGLIVFVLASHLEDKFAAAYRRYFPKVLILMVIMQLVSVMIRINAYGITESRYYLALFGVYSLACGIVLSFKPVAKNGAIALLGAIFAIISVIPPVDAFTVSRDSQIARLECMLHNEGVLLEGKVISKADVPMELRLESTSILNYLEKRDYLQYMNWLPSDFTTEKMKTTFGFEPAYEAFNPDAQFFYANLDTEKPFSVSGYDELINASSFRGMDAESHTVDFQVQETNYKLMVKRTSSQEARVSVRNSDGAEVVGTGLYGFAKSLSEIRNMPKEFLPPELMTFDVENNGYRLRIIFQNINIDYAAEDDAEVDYCFFILFGEPSE